MKRYTSKKVLRLAKRYNNSKRAYLLVNPIQGKHMPASPSESLEMMESLGEKLFLKYPKARLIIGFAETATAIGAVVANAFGKDCIYIHTTREIVDEAACWIEFLEEHSHAVEQKLCGDNLNKWILESPEIIFVDDELSTGKTILNIINKLREEYPQMQNKPIIAASIINRLTDENTDKLKSAGIDCECLLKLPDIDYTAKVTNFKVNQSVDYRKNRNSSLNIQVLKANLPLLNPRVGVNIEEYRNNCNHISSQIKEKIKHLIPHKSKVLVIGTEECMYPALNLGKTLEEEKIYNTVFCHSTTRSPIGICDNSDYPIKTGYKLSSFYDNERESYIYNLERYDTAIIVSDTVFASTNAIYNMADALHRYGCKSLFFVEGGKDVQFI